MQYHFFIRYLYKYVHELNITYTDYTRTHNLICRPGEKFKLQRQSLYQKGPYSKHLLSLLDFST